MLSHATSKITGGGIKNPLQNKGKPVYSAPCETPGARSSMDRASVYGTEDESSEPTKPQELSDNGIAARSAYAAHRSKNTSESSDSDPDLTKIISAWPSLPEHIKAAIKALVKTHDV